MLEAKFVSLTLNGEIKMCYFNKIFDFEDKLHRINSMTYADAQEGLLAMFNEEYKAVAVVGNTDKPFTL